jgi:flagellin
MSITILNNISNLIAENAVSNTQTNLQNTLQQLSTGLKINSGANDPAGLSIANGLGANIAALTQSSQNASNGIGLLQTAGGALSQVTTLLNSAVTIATEAGNGGLTSAQSTALNTEFTSLMNEITQIGTTTNFNGTSVFNGGTANSFTSTQGSTAVPLTSATAIAAGNTVTIQDAETGGTFVYTAPTGGGTIGTSTTGLMGAIANAVAAGTLATGTTATITNGQLVIAGPTGDTLQVSTDSAALGGFDATTGGGESTVFTSDGTSTGATVTSTAIGALSATSLGLNTASLLTTTGATAALTAITAAINQVSAESGNIGSAVNQLTADANVETTEVQNLTSAQNSVQDADIASVTSNLSQYNILEQTGFDALSQSQSAEQNVLKLIQG